MASREDALEAENGRLQAEMVSLKKKIMLALKKQQAELQAKIQAAEQRAMAAEAAAATSYSNSSSEARSDVEVNSSLTRSTGDEISNGEAPQVGSEAPREEIHSEMHRLREELCQLQVLLEDERKQKGIAESSLKEQLEESRQRIEKMSKEIEEKEAQLHSTGQQVSSTVAQMQEKLECLSEERNKANLANERLSLENDSLKKELQIAIDAAALRAKEMQEMLASHKATQECQEAGMAQLMQQMQPIEATSSVGDKDMTSGSVEVNALNHMIEEQKKAIELLQNELSESKLQVSSLKESLDSLSRQHQEVLASNRTGLSEELKERSPLEAELHTTRERLKEISLEHQLAVNNLVNQLKERDEKYNELDLKFNRLQKRAKQRIQEIQKEKDEMAIQLSSAQEKEAQADTRHATVQSDLERFRTQAGDAIRALDGERQSLRNANSKLKEELDDIKRTLAAKEQSLEESRRLVSEKDQSALAMQAEMNEAEQRHVAVLSELEEKNKKIVESLQSQLAEKATETNKLAETISNLQALLIEKESNLTEVEATLTGNVARLTVAIESEKREAAQLKTYQENERQSWQENVLALQNKIQQLEKENRQIESVLEESKRQTQIDMEVQRQLLADAERRTASANEEVTRLNKEFIAYKQRAHALLQKKDSELQAAKDADLAAAQEAILKDAQKQAAAAVVERDRAVNTLKQTVTEFETQLAARNVAVVDAEQRIKDLATKLESVKGLLAYEREEWQKHSREQESSWQEKYDELAKKQKRPDENKIKTELVVLRANYDKLKDEFDNFRDMTNKMMEAKDQEINKLLDDNDGMQKKLRSQLQEELRANNASAEPKPQDTSSPVIAIAEQQILLLARQQAQREEELKQSQRQIQVLQEEISELERENRLHTQQEALLKNELRNMERAARRENVDMTYLKNVILKLLETGEVEALLPVVGMLLQFSPDEVKRCQALYAAAAAESPASTPRLLSRLSFSTAK